MNDHEKLSFEKDFETQKNFDNPFIVKYIESFVENDHFYTITEFADGGSLENYLLRAKPQEKKLSEDEALRYFTMLSLGLYYIHN